jgi:hypothetical protein
MLPAEVRGDRETWKRLVDDVIREFVYEDLSLIHAEVINNAGEPELSEEEIRSKYETLLFSQKQYFTEKRDIVSAAIKYPRDTIVYYPPGLRWVKYFTVPFEAEIRGRAAILLSERRMEEYEKHIQAAESAILPLIRELRQKLHDGYNFDLLAAEYNGAIEDLLYTEDREIFPSLRIALNSLQQPGDIAEYNIYQGHVFMLFDRTPEYVEVPYEKIRDELANSIMKNKKIIQHDRLMKKLYEDAIAAGSVKIRAKELRELTN